MDVEKNMDLKKKIVEKLANTRKVIQNKFQKALKERVSREKELNEKYKPLTSAISKLSKPKFGFKKKKFSFDDDSNHSYDPYASSEHIYDSVNESDTNVSVDSDPDNWSDSEVDGDDDQVEEMEIDPDIAGPSNINKRANVGGDATEDDDAQLQSIGPSKKVKNIQKIKRVFLKPLNYKDRRKIPVPRKKLKRIIRPRDNDELNVGRISTYSDDDDDILIAVSKGGKKKKMIKSSIRARDKLKKKHDAFKTKDVQISRDIRDEVKKRAKAAAEKQIPHFELVSNVEGDNAVAGDDEIIIITDDDDDDAAAAAEIIEGRSQSIKRKSSEAGPFTDKNKYIKIPMIPVNRKKKDLNYVGVKRVPVELVSHKSKFRAQNKQRKPYHIEKVPSITSPYLTLNHVVYRKYVPPIPGNQAPIVTIVKDQKEKSGGNIETNFIPYNENISYEYYDDPNELCDRLRLLIASRAAGNTNHAQEINSIIDELRESRFIV